MHMKVHMNQKCYLYKNKSNIQWKYEYQILKFSNIDVFKRPFIFLSCYSYGNNIVFMGVVFFSFINFLLINFAHFQPIPLLLLFFFYNMCVYMDLELGKQSLINSPNFLMILLFLCSSFPITKNGTRTANKQNKTLTFIYLFKMK